MMRKLSPDVVAQWVEKYSSNESYQPLQDVLFQSLRRQLENDSDEELAELAEALEDQVATALDRRANDYLEEGVVPSFDLSVESGARYYRIHSKPETALLVRLRNATPEAFEVFCKIILSRLKSDAVVEGGPHDGGVDFHAVGLPVSTLANPAPPASKAVVIGQAKRYKEKNDVGESEVRSFVGASIKKADEMRRQYGDRVGILTPVVLAFWTTSYFTTGARELARSMGIWYLNGQGLSQLACRIGLDENTVEEAENEVLHRRI